MNDITIADRTIGISHPPFIIAEMSGNHNQSLERALAIVDAAAGAGAHALKLQTYTADTMTIDLDEREFRIDDPSSLWHGYSLYKLYEEAHTPWEWHRPIFDRCREHGMIVFSTPFDATAVDFLEEMGVPAYKVASFENTDHLLIRKIARTGKPMIMSCGMASVSELDSAVRVFREAGGKDIILLKCTSSYPASPENTNLRTIPHMRDLFDVQVGLSDHTLGIGVAVGAVVLGATVLEKHFTLSRKEGGVDAAFSLEPQELRSLVDETKRVWQGLGEITYGVTEKEKRSLQFRRSLYVVDDVKVGDTFTSENIRAIRPGFGLPTGHFDRFIGKKANKDIARGTALDWEMLSKE